MRVLHCFRWDLKGIEENIKDISKQGFDAVITTSVQPHKEINNNYYDNEWYKYYQPLSLSIGNDKGSKQDLVDLCREAHNNNIKILVDVVLNHVANKGPGCDELIPADEVDIELKNDWFYKEKKCIQNWDDEYQNTHWCINLPSFNLDNWELQDIIKQFLGELIECGVDGFRIDAAKHIGLPRNGISFFERVIMPLKKEGKIIISEVINDHANLVEAFSEYGLVLTNSTNKDHNKIITYVSSHDSDLNNDANGYTRNLDVNTILRDYCELCKYYPNTMFYPRPFDDSWKSDCVRECNFR